MTQPAKATRKPAQKNPAFDPSAIGAVVTTDEPVRRKSNSGAADNPFIPHVRELWEQFTRTGRSDTKAVEVPDAQARPVEFKIRQAANYVGAGSRVQFAPAKQKGRTRVMFTVGARKKKRGEK